MGDEALRKSLAISKNVTYVLDQLLKGYDKRIRPNYAGQLVYFQALIETLVNLNLMEKRIKTIKNIK